MSRRPCDVVGYAYRADVYCRFCILGVFYEAGTSAVGVDVEATLDRIAKARGIGRDDERDFSSDEFPKVVFRDEASEPPEAECGGCGWLLIEQA